MRRHADETLGKMFAERLNDWVGRKCMTVREFAELTGLDYATVALLMNGKRGQDGTRRYQNPTAWTLRRIVAATGIGADYWLCMDAFRKGIR